MTTNHRWSHCSAPVDIPVMFLVCQFCCLCPREDVVSQTGLSSIGDIISCRRLGLFGRVARLDSVVPARDALECAYACHTEIYPPSGWRRPPDIQGRLGCTRLVMAPQPHPPRMGHSRRTRSALWASAAQAFWWWWWSLLQKWFTVGLYSVRLSFRQLKECTPVWDIFPAVMLKLCQTHLKTMTGMHTFIGWIGKMIQFLPHSALQSTVAMLCVRSFVCPSIHEVEAPWSYMWGYFKSNFAYN